ncbi:Dihydroxyacetone kinase [Fusarium austroafricanum]|uniref:Dihydroxyacetone kinase n=1 Tax=Fusarium austroafricanum TaxID=2364996 RepID=A0A8H4K1A1_9HYPO|nr:Dihydroxyacetone kinase [Fusarium austroafricanum]
MWDSDRHFFNDPALLDNYALESLSLANKVVYRQPNAQDHVAVISGGGSGHEPASTGLVGQGFLTASIAGTIFASPSTEQIFNEITKCVTRSTNILIIVMNYTGDVLNLGVAVEKARSMGIQVDMVIIGDYVDVEKLKSGKAGRRGIAETVLVMKTACAFAAHGHTLAEVATVTRLSAANIASIGASLVHVHVPG